MAFSRHIRSPIMHRVVTHGATLYLGGMVAEDRSVGMAGQTEQILKRMEELLLECGSDRTKVLSATIFVTDLGRKAEMDEVWVRFFGAENLPARATIGAATLGGPETLIEVVCTASK
jgi:2-iminobutanoate/2-iminopropanoate deaminase